MNLVNVSFVVVGLIVLHISYRNITNMWNNYGNLFENLKSIFILFGINVVYFKLLFFYEMGV